MRPPKGYGEEERVGDEEKKNIKVVEMEEWQPLMHEDALVEEDEQENLPPARSILPPPAFMPQMPQPMSVRDAMKLSNPKISDVFIKIDKFHSARSALTEVKVKLNEIDNLIKKIRETKMREEQEIAVWERDMEQIKARMRDVTTNIFEKID